MKKTRRITAILLSALMLTAAMPFSSVTAYAEDKTALNNAISAYETKMNGSVYNNMLAAYNAYTDAVGVSEDDDATAAQISAATSALTGATSAMTAFTPYKGTATVKYGNGSTQPTEGQNILWANGSGDTAYDQSQGGKVSSSAVGITYGAYFWFYYPDGTVLLYDGDTAPVLPIMLGCQDKDSNYNIHVRWLYANSSTNYFTMTRDWTGYSDNFGWPSSSATKINVNPNINPGMGDAYEIDNTSTVRSFGNYMTYSSTPGTNTLQTVSGFTWHEAHRMSILGIDTESTDDKILNNTQKVHIINYKKLMDALDSKVAENRAALGKVSDYTQGGLEQLLLAIDEATRNPNSFFASSNNYTDCVDWIDNTITELNGAIITPDALPEEVIDNAEGSKTDFVSKLVDGKYYKNISAVYDLYVQIQAAEDAYKYGYGTARAAAKAANNLETALNTLTEYTKYTPTGTVTMAGDSSAVTSSSYVQNIISAPKSVVKTGSQQGDVITYTSMPENVYALHTISDTNDSEIQDIKIPVMMAWTNQKGFTIGTGARRAMCAYYPNTNTSSSTTNNASFRLTAKWSGRYQIGYSSSNASNGSMFKWSNAASPDTSDSFGGYSSSTFSTSDTSIQSAYMGQTTYDNYLRSYINTLHYISDGASFTDGLKTVKIGFYGHSQWPNNKNDNAGNHYLTNVSTVYVIDYETPFVAFKTKWAGNSSDIATGKYTEGGYKEVFSALDAVSAVDIATVNSSSTATSVAKALADAAADINNANKTQNDTRWQTLRDKIAWINGEDEQNLPVKYTDGLADPEIYTESSWNALVTAIDNAKTHMTELPEELYTSSRAATAESYASAIQTAYDALELRADFSALDKDIADNAGVFANYAYYTYDSYLAFCNAYDAAVSKSSQYSAQVRPNTKKTDAQDGIDTADENLVNAVSGLEPIDDASCYEPFDKALSVIKTEAAQTGKYSDNAKSAMTTLATGIESAVYHEVNTTEEAALLRIDADDLPVVLKNTSTNETDTKTTALLTGINTISEADANYNRYTVTFTVTKGGAQVSSETYENVSFGTAKTFTLGSEYTPDSDTVVWTTVSSDGGSNTVYGGSSFTKKISANLTVTAAITAAPESVGYIYKFYNGNGVLVQTQTHENAEHTDFESVKPAAKMPNMVVSDWYTETDEDSKTVTVKAVYTNESNCTLSVTNGTITNKQGNVLESPVTAQYDKEFTLDYTGEKTFYAWAVKLGEKYTVASYTEEYHFYSHCNLEFVPVYSENGYYYLETGSAPELITASNIVCSPNNYFDFEDDDFVTEMLRIKAPFIAVLSKTAYDTSKCRAYCLVTEGASIDYTRVGIKFTKDAAHTTDQEIYDMAPKTINAVLDSGQFSVTLGSTAYESGKFAATVNFDYNYRGLVNLDVMLTSAIV